MADIDRQQIRAHLNRWLDAGIQPSEGTVRDVLALLDENDELREQVARLTEERDELSERLTLEEERSEAFDKQADLFIAQRDDAQAQALLLARTLRAAVHAWENTPMKSHDGGIWSGKDADWNPMRQAFDEARELLASLPKPAEGKA